MSNCEPIAGLRETQAMPSISFGGNCLYFQGKWLYSYLPVSPGAWGDISHLTVVSQRKFYHRYWISAVSCFFLNTGLRGKTGLLSQRHYQRTWHVWWFSWEPNWDWNLISPLNINYLGIKVSIISLSLSLSPWRCVCLVCLPVRTGVCKYTCWQARGHPVSTLSVFLPFIFIFYYDRTTHWTWSSQIQLNYPANYWDSSASTPLGYSCASCPLAVFWRSTHRFP